MKTNQYESAVIVKTEGAIGHITLNRPERLNAINIGTLELLIEALQGLLDDDAVKVVVLTGKGRAFCSGADQEDMKGRHSGEWERLVERYLDPIRLIANTAKPVIASINGDAVGGGLGLAIASDFRIAVETARFCAPFIAIGLAGCDMSVGYFLPRLVGLGKATEMMMTARFVKTEEAEQIGLVQQVVPAEQLAERTTALAERLAAFSPVAMGWTKKAVRRSLDREMENEFDFEVFAQVQCLQSPEHRESLKLYQQTMMGKYGKS